MASATACPIFSSSSTLKPKRTTPHSPFPSTSAHASCLLMPKVRFLTPGLGSSWTGLKHLGPSVLGANSAKFEKKSKCRGMVVYASLFGVGAPEALVIGVVALLVFGPKGLAEVARTLGKTLRSFQPTIRELQEVSREFKTSLEREIGLDENPSSIKSTHSTTSALSETSEEDVNANGSPSFQDILRASREQLNTPAASTTSEEAEAPTTKSYTSEELLKVTEEQLAASNNVQQLEKSSPLEESQAAPEIAAGMQPSEKPESKN